MRLYYSHSFRVVKDIGKVALAAVLAVVHSGHEDSSTTLEKRKRNDVSHQLEEKSFIRTRSGIKKLPQQMDTLCEDARSCHLRQPCSISGQRVWSSCACA